MSRESCPDCMRVPDGECMMCKARKFVTQAYDRMKESTARIITAYKEMLGGYNLEPAYAGIRGLGKSYPIDSKRSPAGYSRTSISYSGSPKSSYRGGK